LVFVDFNFALVVFVPSRCVYWGCYCVIRSDYSWSSLYDLWSYWNILDCSRFDVFGSLYCV